MNWKKNKLQKNNNVRTAKGYNLNDLDEKLTNAELKDLKYDGDTQDWYQYKEGIWERLSEHEVKKVLWKTLAKDPILVHKLNPEYLKKVMESFAILNSARDGFHKDCSRQD